jgi:hypothetical protein
MRVAERARLAEKTRNFSRMERSPVVRLEFERNLLVDYPSFDESCTPAAEAPVLQRENGQNGSPISVQAQTAIIELTLQKSKRIRKSTDGTKLSNTKKAAKSMEGRHIASPSRVSTTSLLRGAQPSGDP